MQYLNLFGVIFLMAGFTAPVSGADTFILQTSTRGEICCDIEGLSTRGFRIKQEGTVLYFKPDQVVSIRQNPNATPSPLILELRSEIAGLTKENESGEAEILKLREEKEVAEKNRIETLEQVSTLTFQLRRALAEAKHYAKAYAEIVQKYDRQVSLARSAIETAERTEKEKSAALEYATEEIARTKRENLRIGSTAEEIREALGIPDKVSGRVITAHGSMENWIYREDGRTFVIRFENGIVTAFGENDFSPLE
ncbi:hypothetical protein HQ520_16835 [bacterium]|nr:hypothetical protein [bacterium]